MTSTSLRLNKPFDGRFMASFTYQVGWRFLLYCSSTLYVVRKPSDVVTSVCSKQSNRTSHEYSLSISLHCGQARPLA